MQLTFEWDEDKARAAYRKHRVRFEEAKTVFDDPFLLTYPDPDHSADEQRFVSIGLSAQGHTLVVIHTEREDRIRLISCRRATGHERRAYEEENA
jgi:hypothetical protein